MSPESETIGRTGGRPPTKAERTRARILEAAEEVFGRRGFHDASIVEITQRADVAQGTFYVHFESKHQIFEELIRTRGRELRSSLRAAAQGLTRRHDIEAAGFRAYFRWIAEHAGIYRVARTAEFVEETLIDEWYRTFAEPYASALRRAMDAGEIAPGDPDLTAWAVVGMADFVALRFIVWQGGSELPSDRVEAFIAVALRTLGHGQPTPGD